jgi:hypothetical protein
VIAREVTLGGGHAGGAAVPEHFGLGGAEAVRLRVIWPDGERSDWLRPSRRTWPSARRGSGESLYATPY